MTPTSKRAFGSVLASVVLLLGGCKESRADAVDDTGDSGDVAVDGDGDAVDHGEPDGDFDGAQDVVADSEWDADISSSVFSLELYGTFHAMGVIVTFEGNPDPERNAVAQVTYRPIGGGAFLEGFPLSRVASDRFVGSLFWLTPGTTYDVVVTIDDPDGAPLDGEAEAGVGQTRPEIVEPAPSASHHVAPDGSGAVCTSTSPCALTEGLSRAQAGEEVVLHGGIYFEGDIDVPRSGAAGAPIVIRGADEEEAILDGSDPQDFTWIHQGGGVYSTVVNAPDAHLVMADGQRLLPYEDLTNFQNLSRDTTPGHLTDGTTVTVHLAENANPNSAEMVVSRWTSAFYVQQSFIHIGDLTFRYYGAGGYPKAIYLDTASDNRVSGCTFFANDLGVGIKRTSHRNVIEDNVFYETIFDWPWADIKDLGRLEDGGISMYDPMEGRGTVIRRNTFHDDFDGFGVLPSSTAAITNETDVYENIVYNMGDDGVETDGQCSNVRIWGNAFHDVLIGISLAPVYTGPVYALRNLVYRTGVGNNDYPGSPFKLNSAYDASGPIFLFHNTSDAVYPGNAGLDIKSPGEWAQLYARNNIWVGTDFAISNANASQPADLDYDCLWNGEGGGDLVWWGGTRYATLNAFFAGTAQEEHGRASNPGFSDPSTGNYSLAPSSALIDQGLLIPGINHDYSGDGPNVGAFE